jgi:hypothetical protein
MVVLNISLLAQKNEIVTVKAGIRVIDCFPFKERYRYPDFVQARVQFKNGTNTDTKLNYNFLMNEMEYVRLRDTLTLINKKDIKYIAVAQDTFYFDKGYLELIHPGPVKVALRQYIKLKEIQSKDSYGTSSSGSSSLSYNSLPAEGNYYKLTANKDMVFQKIQEYYISGPSNNFIPFSKKSVMQLFPQKTDVIKAYLKSNKVDFDSREDLLRLADYLNGL